MKYNFKKLRNEKLSKALHLPTAKDNLFSLLSCMLCQIIPFQILCLCSSHRELVHEYMPVHNSLQDHYEEYQSKQK